MTSINNLIEGVGNKVHGRDQYEKKRENLGIVTFTNFIIFSMPLG
jgi:hypothetical protein